ncbi:hypothetical protein OG203_43080 [Nocardia sp. NBC_01499]|uniref:hypothetical protein n=1 Tax=Nocardia sp. NBC_01499 TaxID=2903597 RepID=UPI00386C7839
MAWIVRIRVRYACLCYEMETHCGTVQLGRGGRDLSGFADDSTLVEAMVRYLATGWWADRKGLRDMGIAVSAKGGLVSAVAS